MKRLNHKLENKYYKAALFVSLACIICMFMSGCSDSRTVSSSPTPIAPKPAVSPVSQVTPTVTEEKQETAYSYNPIGRKDPFAPIIMKEEKQARAGDRPPLERYNLYDFKLTGIVWGGFGYNAMVEGPDGKGYLVRTGTIIGPNKGVVKKIVKDKMIIEEKFKNFSGETERKEIIIDLRKKQEELQ